MRLFIGGHFDGRRMDVSARHVVLPVNSGENVSMFRNTGRAEQPRELESYRAEFVQSPTCEVVVMVLEGLNSEDVVRMLIDGYRKDTTPRDSDGLDSKTATT